MNETTLLIALTRLPRLNVVGQRQLLNAMGSATAVYENRHDLAAYIPEATPSLLKAVGYLDEVLPRAQEEVEWAENHSVRCIGIGDPAYPQRLKQCPDAPLMLYFCGNADLNASHMISMVGTRQITAYGKELCQSFVRELQALCPNVIIVSGLAYGVDINAHRAALQHGLPTIGVVAHGLNQIYPRLHQQTAHEMTRNGGILTEYMSGTSIDKMNFPARNRIVAGMTEATIVVESAIKGGSLITASLALEYGREVLAFPGRIGDVCSEGCNKIIAEGQATLLTSAADFVQRMGWQAESAHQKKMKQGVQRELFIELSDEEQRVVNALTNSDGKDLGQLSIETGMAIGPLTSLLMQMEIRGITQTMVGSRFRLLTL